MKLTPAIFIAVIAVFGAAGAFAAHPSGGLTEFEGAAAYAIGAAAGLCILIGLTPRHLHSLTRRPEWRSIERRHGARGGAGLRKPAG